MLGLKRNLLLKGQAHLWIVVQWPHCLLALQEKKIERLMAFLVKPSVLSEKDLAARVRLSVFVRQRVRLSSSATLSL